MRVLLYPQHQNPGIVDFDVVLRRCRRGGHYQQSRY